MPQGLQVPGRRQHALSRLQETHQRHPTLPATLSSLTMQFDLLHSETMSVYPLTVS